MSRIHAVASLGRSLARGVAAAAAMLVGCGAALAQPAAASAAGAGQTGYAQRFAQTCAACHGANGRSDMPGVPVIAGQPSLYVVTQLFLFREGRRSNAAMTAVAKALTDDDLRGFSSFIGTLPPVPAPVSATGGTDPARMARGQALATQHQCLACHGADLGGGQQVPRIGGQHEDYLAAALQGFKSGTRAGYTQAMTAVVSQIPAEDLATLACFAAHFPAAQAAAR